MLRFPLLALALLLASGCDGPVGAIDRERGVTAELTADGIRVTNEFEEAIYVAAYGEEALATAFIPPQTVEAPGRALPLGETVLLRFSEEDFIRSDDGFYSVTWITVKGSAERPVIGPRGSLELRR
ncbi:hypothetical protein [Rubricoccus marinus]|nr:hypothetical protein [Rubricoccus marinus]